MASSSSIPTTYAPSKVVTIPFWTLDPGAGSWYWRETSTVEHYSDYTSAHSQELVMQDFLPSDVKSVYNSGPAPQYVKMMEDAFSSGEAPAWFSSMPGDLQSYMASHYMTVDGNIDWQGTNTDVLKALVPTTRSDGSSTTVAGTAGFAVSAEVSLMSVLSGALPGLIYNLRNDEASANGPFASAMYSEFASGTTPSWFTAMPAEVQSFLVLDYIPNWMSGQPMTLRVLGETAMPGAMPTSGPSSTTSSSTTPGSTPHSSDHHVVPIVVSTVVPIVALAALLTVILLLMRRKRRQRQTPIAHIPADLDPEQAIRRWSDTTYSHKPNPEWHASEKTQESLRPLPEISIDAPPSNHALRASRSENDLRRSLGAADQRRGSSRPDSGRVRSELEASPARELGRAVSPLVGSGLRS